MQTSHTNERLISSNQETNQPTNSMAQSPPSEANSRSAG
jgi:hypothetical protein